MVWFRVLNATFNNITKGLSWSWLCGSWIYNYLCNQCLSPLKLQVWILCRQDVLHTTLCDKVCQWLAAGWWFSTGTPISSANKTDRNDMTEILLKVALNTIKHLPTCTLSTFIAMFWVSVLIVVVILSVRYYQYCLLLITNILHLFLGCITWWWLLYWRTCPVC